MNKPLAIFLLVVCMFAIFADMGEASSARTLRHIIHKRCVGFDGVCSFNRGEQGYCCGGMYCNKQPDWAEGRCYYNGK